MTIATAAGAAQSWLHPAISTRRSSYLNICQVDSPDSLVQLVWRLVLERRQTVGRVIDYGAGDGRFCPPVDFAEYLGIEVDTTRLPEVTLPPNAKILNGCAFDYQISDADLAIGNPPYVRNQDLPPGWRHKAAGLLQERTGTRLSSLANAYQYFFLLSLTSVSDSGLVALVLPYEWISRPSAIPLRNFIKAAGWQVDVYRLSGSVFPDVLTDAAITVVDRSKRAGDWKFYELGSAGLRKLPTETPSTLGSFPYTRLDDVSAPRAKRGLSPGSQPLFVLPESQRARLGLEVGRDVVACVTSLKRIPYDLETLDTAAFERYYRDTDARCWLIRTDQTPSEQLSSYLSSVPEDLRLSSTCRNRSRWWQFTMPQIPDLLVSQSFKGTPTPKVVTNSAAAVAVGGVAGVYGASRSSKELLTLLRRGDLVDRLVPYANSLHKIEIGQINSILGSLDQSDIKLPLL